MGTFLDAAFIAALIAVFATLCVGIYTLLRGGEFARSHSNKLMRLRVALQFVAVLILLGAFWWRAQVR